MGREWGRLPSGNRALTSVIIFTLSLQLMFPFASVAATSDDFCQESVADEGKVQAVPAEITAEAKVLLDDVLRSCPSPNACSDDSIQQVVSHSLLKKKGKFSAVLHRILILPRRALLLVIWGASILGPGVISYYATAGMPDGLRISFSSFVMVMSGVLFGRTSGPIEKKLGPWVETMAFHLWSPGEHDAWGQIMKNLSEADRLKYGQVLNQMLVLRSYFELAGQDLKKGDHRLGARHFVNAILNSYDLFAGLHLKHPTTIRELRTYLPNVEDMPMAERMDILRLAHEVTTNLGDDELSPGSRREEILKIVDTTMKYWLKI